MSYFGFIYKRLHCTTKMVIGLQVKLEYEHFQGTVLRV